MNYLSNQDLMQVDGGIALKWILGGVAIGVVFVASVIYGYLHPTSC